MKPELRQLSRFPFTKKSISALPPHNADSRSREGEYTDSETIGLKLRVSKSGRRFFQHRYRYLGRKKCMTLGEFPHVTLQEARKRVSEHKALLARDIDPAEERQQKQNDLTLAEFSKEYYVPHITMHKKSWQTDVYMIDRSIKPALGNLRLSTITVRDINNFHAKEKSRNTASTGNKYLILVRRMLNLAVKWGLLEKNPASGLDKFKEPPHRERYLDKKELPRFIKALNEQEDQLSVAAIRLLLFTGCRKGEILSLKWNQVRLDEGRLFLPVTKNGKSRSVILNDKAQNILEELLPGNEDKIQTQTSDFVFPSRAGTSKGHLYDLRKTFEKVCIAANINSLRIHDLRHTAATWSLMGGSSLYEVQKMLGHSDISMTQRYAHMADENLQKATDNLANMIELAIND